MQSKCFRRGCNFVQDVAHMDEALDTLQQHYRAVHPTKRFTKNREAESLENYNLDADEVFEQNNLSRPDAEPQYDWRYLRSQVTQWKRQEQEFGMTYMHPDTVAEVDRRVEEYFANQPAPEAAAPMPPRGVNRIWMADNAVAPPPFDAVDVPANQIRPVDGF